MSNGTGLLSEHEAASQAPAEEYQEPPEERETRALVERLYKEAKAHRKQYDDPWLRNYKFYRGKQWEERRPSYRHSEVVNLVFKEVNSVIPIMTDSKPKISFLPQEPADLELSQILNEVSESDWDKHNWLRMLTEVLYDGHFYGHGLAYAGYDPDADYGAGAVELCSEDVFYNYPDPNAKEVNGKDSRYWVKAEPVDVDILRNEYPAKAAYIRSDLDDMSYEDKTALEEIKYRAPNRDKVYLESEERPKQSRRPQALKITLYVKSGEVIEQTREKMGMDGQAEVDPDTGKPVLEYESRLKYPNGRKIVMGGGILLEDGPMPFDDGLIPYAKYTNYILPREFYGISDIEQLKSPQIMFNKLISFAMDVMTLMGNPIWVVDNDSGIDTENIVNRPGLVVEKNKGSEVRREEGVQLQPYVLQMIDRMKSWFDDVSGDTDVSRGVSSEGVTAASAIQALQEASRTRIRQKSRNLDVFLQELGQLYKNRIFQFYSAPRIFRLTQNQGAQKFFKLHIEKRDDGKGGVQRVATVRPYVQDLETGAFHESLEAKEYIMRGDFDVRVTTGSSLPFAKKEKEELAKDLFDRGIVDAEEVLTVVDYPNREAVLMRMQEKAAQEAEAQAAGGAPPPGAA